jgi:hypothetical protein
MIGERARLIPVGPDSQKERKAVSTFLATLVAVEEYGKDLLTSIGARAGKKATLACYTEVTEAGSKGAGTIRPDGLIVVTYAGRVWSALVEAKVGTEQHDTAQIEGYLDLARDRGIDAVITISNQFSPDPRHSPVSVHGAKLRSVELFHWSWRYLISRAQLAEKNKEISDPDQSFILSELVRYLSHDASGVRSFTSMGPTWKQTCLDVHQGKRLLKEAPATIEAATNWLQLGRFLSLEIGLAVGKPVSVYLTNKQKKDPSLLHSDVLDELAADGLISVGFEVPNTASPLWLKLDLHRRNLAAWMGVDAPADRKQPRAAVTWLTRQLKEVEQPDNVLLHAYWPYRGEPGIARLTEVLANPDALLELNREGMPKRFEVLWLADLAGDVSRSRIFVETAEKLVLDFYKQIGQNLKPWVAPPPKVIGRPGDPGGLGDQPEAISEVVLPPPSSGLAEDAAK